MSDTPIDERIARAFLAAEGVSVVDAIHARDEMLSVIGRHAGRAESAVRFDYLKAGREAMRVIEDVMRVGGVDLRAARVLEFGCGFGRVTRHLAPLVGDLSVSDVHEPAVDFVRATWGVAASSSTVEPSVPAGEPYDVILALSVLNHLPAARFSGWLGALIGALRPGGILCFSTHDASLMPGVPVGDDGYAFVAQSESGHLDPREYGSAFVEAPVVEDAIRQAGGAVLSRSPRELWFFQDLWVVARAGDPGSNAGFAERRAAVNVRGRAESIRIDEEGRMVAAGWAADIRSGAPLERVSLFAGPEPDAVRLVGEAACGIDTPGQASYMRRDDFAAAGWSFDGTWPTDARVVWFEGAVDGMAQRFDVATIDWAPGRRVIIE